MNVLLRQQPDKHDKGDGYHTRSAIEAARSVAEVRITATKYGKGAARVVIP